MKKSEELPALTTFYPVRLPSDMQPGAVKAGE